MAARLEVPGDDGGGVRFEPFAEWVPESTPAAGATRRRPTFVSGRLRPIDKAGVALDIDIDQDIHPVAAIIRRPRGPSRFGRRRRHPRPGRFHRAPPRPPLQLVHRTGAAVIVVPPAEAGRSRFAVPHAHSAAWRLSRLRGQPNETRGRIRRRAGRGRLSAAGQWSNQPNPGRPARPPSPARSAGSGRRLDHPPPSRCDLLSRPASARQRDLRKFVRGRGGCGACHAARHVSRCWPYGAEEDRQGRIALVRSGVCWPSRASRPRTVSRSPGRALASCPPVSSDSGTRPALGARRGSPGTSVHAGAHLRRRVQRVQDDRRRDVLEVPFAQEGGGHATLVLDVLVATRDMPMSPGASSLSMRDAMLTPSPWTSPSARTTSPMWTPIRTWNRPSSATADG